jgi:lipoyl(octanoyl) transferase
MPPFLRSYATSQERQHKAMANIRILGRADYEPTWRAMQAFNAERDEDTDDEIWLLEHPPVFTLGLAGDPSHVLNPGEIPVVKIDRGGQVTYHGPGQLVCYLLLDIRRLGYGVKSLVRRIEESVVGLLSEYRSEAAQSGLRIPSGPPSASGQSPPDSVSSLTAHTVPGMPGVYIGEGANLAKISAIGLRVSRHCTYHGLSLNVDMDLEPFTRINPCGYPDLKAAQLSDLGVSDKISVVGDKLVARLQQHLY